MIDESYCPLYFMCRMCVCVDNDTGCISNVHTVSRNPLILSLSLFLSVLRYCNRMSVREAVQVGAVLGTVCVAGALYISRR